ncbi:hypothetical protein GCWU000341_00069 [Oribacterium sp. oral taxon 078 str. F0262]|nr:hypothetical protein GCWU000341_00069 [Oribacterium sp. oral taxon 078 str. F0262]
MTRPLHEHAAGRSHAGMRMKGAGRERPGPQSHAGIIVPVRT